MQPLCPADADLLLACIASGRTHNADPGADWDTIIEAAERHGVAPLLYRNVCRQSADVIPAAALGRLARVCLANAGHNLALTRELLRLLALFENNGLRAVAFKGPILADILFGDVSLRQFADLDILVREEDIRRAKRLLMADEYRPEFELGAHAEDEYIRSEHAFQLRKKHLGFVVELHWRFGSRNQVFPVTPEQVWNRLECRTFHGRPVLTLCREDLLLYLAVHGAKHGWERLEWIVCIRELVRGADSLCWEQILSQAAASGALRALQLALLLADDLGSGVVPASLRVALLQDQPVRRLAHQVRQRLFLPEQDHPRREVYRHAFYLQTRERWRDRARILLHSSMRVPHPYARDWTIFRIPSSLSFLYYVLRPVRLMGEHGFRRLRDMLRADTGV